MNRILVLPIVASLMLISCSSDDESSATSQAPAATVVDTEPTATTDVSTTEAPVTTAPATQAPATQAPATAAPTTAAPATQAPATAAPASLPKVEIVLVQSSAGSGEVMIVVDRKPEGWTRFKVSFDGPNGPSVRADILDVRDSDGGVAIIARSDDYAGGVPLTIAVSWVNDAGVTSAIAYATCDNGIPLSGTC